MEKMDNSRGEKSLNFLEDQKQMSSEWRKLKCPSLQKEACVIRCGLVVPLKTEALRMWGMAEAGVRIG